MKICFSRVISAVARVLWGIAIHVANVYLCGTEEHSPLLEALTVKSLEFTASKLA